MFQVYLYLYCQFVFFIYDIVLVLNEINVVFICQVIEFKYQEMSQIEIIKSLSYNLCCIILFNKFRIVFNIKIWNFIFFSIFQYKISFFIKDFIMDFYLRGNQMWRDYLILNFWSK